MSSRCPETMLQRVLRKSKLKACSTTHHFSAIQMRTTSTMTRVNSLTTKQPVLHQFTTPSATKGVLRKLRGSGMRCTTPTIKLQVCPSPQKPISMHHLTNLQTGLREFTTISATKGVLKKLRSTDWAINSKHWQRRAGNRRCICPNHHSRFCLRFARLILS